MVGVWWSWWQGAHEAKKKTFSENEMISLPGASLREMGYGRIDILVLSDRMGKERWPHGSKVQLVGLFICQCAIGSDSEMKCASHKICIVEVPYAWFIVHWLIWFGTWTYITSAIALIRFRESELLFQYYINSMLFVWGLNFIRSAAIEICQYKVGLMCPLE